MERRPRPAAARPSRAARFLETPAPPTALVVLLHLASAFLAYAAGPHTGGDNTSYLALSRSLLEHGRYLELWDPVRPPHTQYPPGFPALLAVARALGLDGWAGLQAGLMIPLSGLAVGLGHLWMRRRIGPGPAFGAGLLLAVSPRLAADAHWILSDVPFWAAVMATLLALEARRTRLAIALALLAFTVRTAALPLLAALVAWLALRRRWRGAAALAGGVAVVVLLWTLRAPTGVPYSSYLWMVDPYRPELGTVGPVDLAVRLAANAEAYAFRFLMEALTGARGLAADVVAGAVLGFATLGLGVRLRAARRPAGPWVAGVAELFTVVYLAILLVWPSSWAGTRFLLPLLPITLAYAVEGTALAPAGWRRALRWAGAAAIAALAIAPSVSVYDHAADCRRRVAEEGPFACLPGSARSLMTLAVESRGWLPADAVAVARKPSQWYWLSGVPARIYPFSDDPDRLFEVADSVGARYLVRDHLGRTSRAYLDPALRDRADRFCELLLVSAGGGEAALLGILPAPPSDGRERRRDERVGDAGLRGPALFPPCPPGYEATGPGSGAEAPGDFGG